MPPTPNDALLKSYVPADLAAAAEGAAWSRGISVSQFIREALRREVGGHDGRRGSGDEGTGR